MGRVFEFSYYQEKTKKSLQYHGSSVDLFAKDVGVLCTSVADLGFVKGGFTNVKIV